MSTNTIKLFGTDGIRAEAGRFPLDDQTVEIIGASLADHLRERTGDVPRIIVGRDTRESGNWIAQRLVDGARRAGADTHSAGIIPTPGVAFLTRVLPADAGVVVSASHNPFYDNGIKIFDPSGKKLDDVTEHRIESDILAGQSEQRAQESRPHHAYAAADGQHAFDLQERYLEFLVGEVAERLSLDELSLVVDCANGAAYTLAPKLMQSLGARVHAINAQPNGRNINLDCGSLHLDGLRESVLEHKADLGVAFDGDADRALFVDAKGNVVDGDGTLWILANYLKKRRELPGNKVVATVMSNIGLEIALRDAGIELVRTDVGDKYVLDELLSDGAALGGEQSGHIIFPRISLAGDGMITTLCLLRTLREEQQSLSDLVSGFRRYPQVLVNVRVREKAPFDELPDVPKLLREIDHQFQGRGRLLLRYSGTEPLARIMLEADDEAEIHEAANRLANAIRREIGEGDSEQRD